MINDGGGGGMAVVEMTGVAFCLHSVETWDGVLWLTGCSMHCDMYDACTLPSGNIPLTLLLTVWSCTTCLFMLSVCLHPVSRMWVTFSGDGLTFWVQLSFIEDSGDTELYNGVGRCQKSGGGAHRHVIYVPSVKNHYKRVVFGCMVI